jgi:2,3-dihydroxybenzoate decarboxylase
MCRTVSAAATRFHRIPIAGDGRGWHRPSGAVIDGARDAGQHPDRFCAFAALPLQDPAAAAAELERAVTQLGFCGALVNDCVFGPGGRYLDAPEYDEVWSALKSLGVPLYLHPGAPPAEQWQVLQGRPEL